MTRLNGVYEITPRTGELPDRGQNDVAIRKEQYRKHTNNTGSDGGVPSAYTFRLSPRRLHRYQRIE